MANLLDILRQGVKIADEVTKPLQATVIFKKAVSDTSYAGFGYPSSVKLKALVDWRQKQVRTSSGVLSVSRAMVTFLDVEALKKATKGDGIEDRDVIILPDGTTGPILDMAGFIDAGTKQPLATEVYLG